MKSSLKDLLQSKFLRGLAVGALSIIILCLVFQAGVFVGFKKARFSGGYPRLTVPELPGGHGAIGKIISVSLPQLTIIGSDGLEKSILIATSTRIEANRERRHENIGKGTSTPQLGQKTPELAVGDSVAVLGAPNDQGVIEARFIKILSPLPHEKN